MRASTRINHDWRRIGGCLVASLCLASLYAEPLHAQSTARITGLSNVSFGTLGSLDVDHVRAQSVCAYTSARRYSVRATGSSNGAFSLVS